MMAKGRAKIRRGFCSSVMQSKLQAEITPSTRPLACRQVIWFYVFIYNHHVILARSVYHV